MTQLHCMTFPYSITILEGQTSNCFTRERSSFNIATMTTSQWYSALSEGELMEFNEDGLQVLITTREEKAHPTLNWQFNWSRARINGLGSEAMSFLWKMMHNILPTEARLSRKNSNSSPNCKFCPIPHCLFGCDTTKEVGDWILWLFRKYDIDASPIRLSKLDFNFEGCLEFPHIWLLAHTLLYAWDVRHKGRIASLVATRARLEKKMSNTQKSRLKNEVTIMANE